MRQSEAPAAPCIAEGIPGWREELPGVVARTKRQLQHSDRRIVEDIARASVTDEFGVRRAAGAHDELPDPANWIRRSIGLHRCEALVVVAVASQNQLGPVRTFDSGEDEDSAVQENRSADCVWATTHHGASIGAAAERCRNRAQEDPEVRHQRPLPDVLPVELHHFLEIDHVASAAHLPQPGYSGQNVQAFEVV